MINDNDDRNRICDVDEDIAILSQRVMLTLEMVEMGEKLGDSGMTPKVDLQDLICPQIFTLRHSA